jgi:hypothetical protein
VKVDLLKDYQLVINPFISCKDFKIKDLRFVIWEMRNAHATFVQKPEGRDRDIYRRIILKLMLKNRVGGCGLDSGRRGYDPVVKYCEHYNEL